ncbi:MAG: hypothetical protein WCD76_07010 [Pyrinomonadaceae bacterium]
MKAAAAFLILVACLMTTLSPAKVDGQRLEADLIITNVLVRTMDVSSSRILWNKSSGALKV